MKKRIISFLLVMALVLSMAPMVAIEAEAATTYVVGNGVTIPNSSVPADGSNKYCQCGTNVGSGSHWCCWQYGYNVYKHIWGKSPDRYDTSTHYLREVAAKDRTLTAENLKKYLQNAKPGALVRIDKESSPSAGDNNGHTLVFVKMNGSGDGAIFLEGNYDGKGRTRLHEWKFSSLISSYGPGSRNNYQYIKYICWPNADAYGDYLSECKFYPTNGTVKMIKDATLKSLPCSKDTDANSQDVYKAKKNEEFAVTAIYENTAGNYWYQTKYNNTICYIYGNNVSHMAIYEGEISISKVSAPSQIVQGKPFSIKGLISSTELYMKSVTASVYKVTETNGTYNYDLQLKSQESICSKTYELYNSKVDIGLKFNDLPVGTYLYVVEAHVYGYWLTDDSWVNDNIENELKCVYDKTEMLYSSVFTVTTASTSACSHSYNAVVTAPTCTAQGYTKYTCTKCGHSYTSDPTNTVEHSYGAWETQTAATCLTDGVQKRTCSGCGDVQTQSVPAIGHNYVGYTVDATCTQYGYIVYTCSHCGDSYESGSGYSEWSTTYPSGVDASRIESRTEYRYQTKNFTTAATNVLAGWTYYGTITQWSDWGEWSDWSKTAVEASDSVQVETRQAWGYYYYLCPSCGAHMHGYGQCWTWAKDPVTGKGGCGATTKSGDFKQYWSTTDRDDVTFKDWHGTGKKYAYVDGQLVFYWDKGGETTQYRYRTRTQETVHQFYQWSNWSDWSATPVSASDTVNVETRTVYRYALGELAAHQYGAWVEIQAGSCTQATVLQRACVHCGHYETQETPAPGHSYNAVITAPTCTEKGYTTYTCSVCGDRCVDNETPALGHTEEILPGKEPTCMESGLTEGKKCSVCGEILVAQEVILSPYHGYETVVTAPTCTEQGYTTHTCTRCGDNYVTDYVDALGHDYESVVTEPTYAEQGYTTHTCSRCGDSYVDSYTGPLVPEPDVKVTIGTVSGKAGDVVEVYLTLENAPELRSLAISNLVYDRENLTLVSGQWLKDGAMMAPWDNGKEEGALLFEGNRDLNGEIFKLTFTINEAAPAGEYGISCTLVAKQREESGRDLDVPVAVAAGAVEVIEYIAGDVDGSEFVSTDDAIYLLYNIMFGDGDYPVNQDCDFDGSGFVSTDDAIYLLYHIMFGEEDYPLY